VRCGAVRGRESESIRREKQRESDNHRISKREVGFGIRTSILGPNQVGLYPSVGLVGSKFKSQVGWTEVEPFGWLA